MVRSVSLVVALVLVAGACGVGAASEPAVSADAVSYATIQGDELVLADLTGPAVVFVWVPG